MGIQQTKLIPYNCQLTYDEAREKIINGSLSANTIPVEKYLKGVDTYLQYAIKKNDEKFVDYLLRNSVDINFNSKNCHPAIYLAVEKNDKKLVKKLLDANADINLQSQYEGPFPVCEQFTPLQLAVKLNHYEIIELLISYGADINACCSIIEEYQYMGHPSFVIYRNAILPNTMHHFTPLHIAVNNEDEEIVDLLIENKADVNNSPKYNFVSCLHATSKTPLGIAIKKKNLTLVKKLITAGADVNISSWNDYWTPLHLAAELDASEIALLLINNGANVNAVSNISLGYCTTTPLRIAIKNNHLEMVKLLVKNGALVNFQVNDFLPPILCSIFTFVRSREMIDYLLESGADMNFDWRSEKSTFLHYVASMNDGDLMPFLLTHKYVIDINTVTSKKESVLHKAVQCIYESNSIHLLNAGIDINLVDINGNTAHDIAYESDQYSYKSIIERHVVKLTAAGIYVSDKNLQTVEGAKYDNLREECLDIVALMKKTKIVGSDVTYYQLLYSHRNKLARILKYLDVDHHEFFFYANYFSKFTRYSEILWYRKIMIKQRILLLKEAEKFLDEVMSDVGLPDTLLRNITDYLSNRELYILGRR
ncbi:ankyrin-1-like [Cotesia glomerata]|uniref:ankyrin-1-like n=1 Tax=Cotesia glomerata TaxID=32391 RepID=UPI001D0180F0|nr:ankyrin-1-like [Cotesia glomerata]